jgi:hypothetical protein
LGHYLTPSSVLSKLVVTAAVVTGIALPRPVVAAAQPQP